MGFGGGCHWCTEAVFQSLRGVERVDQGWIASRPPYEAPSEAVLVHFRPDAIGLRTLIEIHLLTHASTSDHSMRGAYRSAIYTLTSAQRDEASGVLDTLRNEMGDAYITQVLPFVGFVPNQESLLNYYRTRPDAPFCQTYIHPKLQRLRAEYSAHVAPEAILGDASNAA